MKVRLALALLLATAAAAPAQVVRRAPEWNVDTWLNLPPGKERARLADYRGKVVVLYCFQAFCPGCLEHGFPTLKKLVEHYADAGRDVAFVAVQTVFEGFEHNTLEAARQRAEQFGLEIPIGHDAGPDGEGSKLMRRYHTRGTPWTIVIDRRGRIRYGDFTVEVDEAVELIDGLIEEDPLELVGAPIGSLKELRWLTDDGEEPDLGAHRLTLLRWWTDTCPYCADSLPDLIRLYRRYARRGLGFYGVYHPKPPRAVTDREVRRKAARLRFPRGHLAVDPEWKLVRRLMERGELERATSISVLIDADGIVRWAHAGPRLHRSKAEAHPRAARDFDELEKIVRDFLVPAEEGADKKALPRKR